MVAADELLAAIEDGATEEGATDESAVDEGAIDESATDEGAIDEGAVDERATDDGDELVVARLLDEAGFWPLLPPPPQAVSPRLIKDRQKSC